MDTGTVTTRGRVVARPVWLGHPNRPAFGWWHGPADGRVRAGVLLCPPLGFDYLQSQRALRVLADELATAGFCVVRFDYDGTGDSAGGRSDARLASWSATADSALALLRRHGVTDVCLVGMRFGALFAATAAARDGAVDQLVLWDPCASGRSFLAEERALARLSGGAQTTTPDDGALHAAHIVYDAATLADVGAMRIEECGRPLSRRVLVLARADRPRVDALCDATLAREAMDQGEAIGQQELIDRVPPYQELPLTTVRRIVQWLSEGACTQLRTVSAPEAGGQVVVDGWRSMGRPVVETPVTVPPTGLFGVLTEPGDGDAPREAPLALMLNAGNQHHVGPARSWVELSRRWAAAGIRSLRLDLSGLGDSPFRRPDDSFWTCHKPDAFDDVFETVRWACPDDPSNVVLVGLCSGGYQALESGLILRARGVVAINPAVSFTPAEHLEGADIDPRRRIILPQANVVSALREGGHFGGLRERYPDLAWRTRIMLSPRQRSAKWLAQLVHQGTDTLIICGDGEMRPIRQGLSAAGLRRLRRSGLLRLEHVPGLEHALPVAGERELIHDMVTEHVLSRFHPAQNNDTERRADNRPTLSDVPA
jgi:pimeloyl-ACP methyl ester carboxylesterase